MAFIGTALVGYFFVSKGTQLVEKIMEESTEAVFVVQTTTENLASLPEKIRDEKSREEYAKKSEAVRQKYGL